MMFEEYRSYHCFIVDGMWYLLNVTLMSGKKLGNVEGEVGSITYSLFLRKISVQESKKVLVGRGTVWVVGGGV